MTSLTRGPLPPRVYWRRRLAVLGVLAVALLVVVGLFRGGGGDPPDQAATTASSTTDSSSDSTEQQDRAARRAERQARREERLRELKSDSENAPTSPSTNDLAAPSGSCSDDEVSVTPTVSGAVAGQPVTISLHLRGLEQDACTWEVSPDHLVVKISQDGEEVWASRECPHVVPRATVVVRSAATSTLSLVWKAHQSDPGCPLSAPYAEAGDYQVEAAAFGGEPSESAFELAEPVRQPQLGDEEDGKNNDDQAGDEADADAADGSDGADRGDRGSQRDDGSDQRSGDASGQAGGRADGRSDDQAAQDATKLPGRRHPD